jgi:Ca-activated chloride channel homolog
VAVAHGGGPRYLGPSWQTPDADRITVEVADQPLAVVCRASVAVADAMVGAPSSPSHELAVSGDGIALAGALDRDLVVRWPAAAPEPGVRIEAAHPAGDPDAYALITLVPPATPARSVPRDLCLLLDVSGSMSGAPLSQLKSFATSLIEGLGAGDRLEVIAFASSPMRWRAEPAAIDARTRGEAVRWVASLRAGGGTAMHDAVTEALRPLRADAERQVVLMTDGYIGFEQQVIGLIRGGLPPCSRIHTVGVGSSVNRTLTGGVARAGGGHEAIVGPDEDVAPAVQALLARTGEPQWIDVTVTGTAVREVAPAAIGDLLGGAPSRISARIDPAGGTVVITARTATGVERREMRLDPVAPGAGRRVIATRFARERVEDLETGLAGGERHELVDAAIEALGLRHRIATRRTSWVAATDEATVDPGDPTRRETIPHQLPYGVSAEGVGLRALPSPPPPPASAAPRRPAPARETVRRQRAMAARDEGAPPAPSGFGREEERSKGEAQRQGPPRRAVPPAEFDTDFLGGAADADDLEESHIVDIPTGEVPLEAIRRLSRRLIARVVSLADGRLVLEATLDEDTDWQPDPVLVVAADGSRRETTPVAGTTRAGRIGAGRVVRLVIAWTGALPSWVEVGGLQLAVER